MKATGKQVYSSNLETSATGTLSSYGDYQFNFGSHVGGPFANCEVKLIDAPSLSYFAEDEPNPRGEICFRGPSNMIGYYKEKEKTSETLDSDGWIHTGDVGELLPNGTLKIIDRVKAIQKLSQGEYISPENLEMKVKNPYILQSFIYGDSLKSYVVAVVVPDPDTAISWANSKGIPHAKTVQDLVESAAFNKLMLNEITTTGLAAGLHKFEIPKAIHLHGDPFSVENGLLTPTFKMKRAQIKALFNEKIAEMYKIGGD